MPPFPGTTVLTPTEATTGRAPATSQQPAPAPCRTSHRQGPRITRHFEGSRDSPVRSSPRLWPPGWNGPPLDFEPRASHPADQEPTTHAKGGDRPSSTDLELRARLPFVDLQSGSSLLGVRPRVARRHCARAPQGRLRSKSDRQRDARFPREAGTCGSTAKRPAANRKQGRRAAGDQLFRISTRTSEAMRAPGENEGPFPTAVTRHGLICAVETVRSTKPAIATEGAAGRVAVQCLSDRRLLKPLSELGTLRDRRVGIPGVARPWGGSNVWMDASCCRESKVGLARRGGGGPGACRLRFGWFDWVRDDGRWRPVGRFDGRGDDRRRGGLSL